jgi:threonyl-tRNA synthetase
MSSIEIVFPDNTKREYPKKTTPLQIAASISEGLARQTVAAALDGIVIDANRPLMADGALELLKFDDPRGQEVFWHSSAHILAQAVLRLYPDAKPTIGPPLEDGFYYDFAGLDIGEDAFERLEEEMKRIAKEDLPSERVDFKSAKEAQEAFKDNQYKLEIISESQEELSAYQQGEFIDLCRGPHIPRTGLVKAVWLNKLSGAYWRGDADNEQLTRIYGITFPDKKMLKEYKERLEEAKKRDHRALGRKLDYYGFEEVSPGSPFFYPKGTLVYNELLKFLRSEYEKRGYQEVITPLLYDKSLWERSGHWEHYRENMFVFQDKEQVMSLKPMNCPSHCLVYNRTQHSYRDLPVRIADFAALHRNELRGTLGGLTRVRKMSQDDAHIFCTKEQIGVEIAALIDFARHIYVDVMKMDFHHVELSTRPEKFMGEVKDWDAAEKALAKALDQAAVAYVVNEGDGAFYGPKIDFHIQDALGRTWQTATIQLDFQLPQRFGCAYLGEDGQKHDVVMIHRALLGSLERFLGVLMEHYAGKLPLWLSPEQVRVLPITDRNNDYAQKTVSELGLAGLRASVDDRRETLNKKVREAQLDYVPYILVVGDKEASEGTVTVRTRDGTVHGAEATSAFCARLTSEVAARG